MSKPETLPCGHPPEMLPCGHPVQCVTGRTTHYCGWCAAVVATRRAALMEAAEIVRRKTGGGTWAEMEIRDAAEGDTP